MHIDQKLVDSIGQNDDATLRTMVQQNMMLSRAILADLPALAEDAGYEPFSKDWISRYWRSLLSEVSGTPLDKLYEWALQASATAVATLLVQRFGLDVAAYPAAIALAILLLRAALTSKDPKKPQATDEKKSDASDQ